MLEWYSDSMAVEKMLGEVYDTIEESKSITRTVERLKYDRHVLDMMNERDYSRRWVFETDDIVEISQEIYKKYLSDSNGWGETTTVSE